MSKVFGALGLAGLCSLYACGRAEEPVQKVESPPVVSAPAVNSSKAEEKYVPNFDKYGVDIRLISSGAPAMFTGIEVFFNEARASEWARYDAVFLDVPDVLYQPAPLRFEAGLSSVKATFPAQALDDKVVVIFNVDEFKKAKVLYEGRITVRDNDGE